MTTDEAKKLVTRYERAVIDSQHKLATAANHYLVAKIRQEIIELLVSTGRKDAT